VGAGLTRAMSVAEEPTEVQTAPDPCYSNSYFYCSNRPALC
jgi:hypothetical protein